MPNWNLIAVVGAVVLLLSLAGWGGWALYHSGASNCVARQATAQIQTDQKIRNQDAKIDQAMPLSGNKRASVNFLLAHTAGNR